MNAENLRRLIAQGCYPDVLYAEQVEGFVASVVCDIEELPESAGTVFGITIAAIPHIVTYVLDEPHRQYCQCTKWKKSKGRRKCEGFYAVVYRLEPPKYREPSEDTVRSEHGSAQPLPPITRDVQMPRFLTDDERLYKPALKYAETYKSMAFRAIVTELFPPIPQKPRGRKRLQTREKLYAAFIKTEGMSYERASGVVERELVPNPQERIEEPNEL